MVTECLSMIRSTGQPGKSTGDILISFNMVSAAVHIELFLLTGNAVYF